jgi:hypothetical protein
MSDADARIRRKVLDASVVLLNVWVVATCLVFNAYGIFASGGFFSFGIKNGTRFLSTPIDSWRAYAGIMAYVGVNAAMTELSTTVVQRYMANTFNLMSTPTIIYTYDQRGWVYVVATTNAVFVAFSGLTGLYVSLCQVDFFLVGLAVRVALYNVATYMYMRKSRYLPAIDTPTPMPT